MEKKNESVVPKDDKSFHILCECRSPEHMITVSQYNDGDEHDDAHLGHCVIQTSMNHYLPWYRRIWVAMKYVFKAEYNNYTETIVDIEKLRIITSELYDLRPEDKRPTKESIQRKHSIEVL